MIPLRHALAILLMAVATLPAAASPTYSNLFVFGDSLSDNGNLFDATGGTVPTPSYYSPGRFTNGPSYSELLWHLLDLPGNLSPVITSPVPTFDPSATNYAVGGARSRYHVFDMGSSGLPPALDSDPTAFSLRKQIDLYEGLTGGVSDSNALYLLWLGSNDVFDILKVASTIGPTTAEALMAQSLDDIKTALTTLIGSGARRFLLPSVPDIGLTPEIRALGGGAMVAATATTQTYNAGLADIIAGLSSDPALELMRFDGFAFLQEANAHPAALGFSNTKDACLTGVFVTEPTAPATGTICATPASYLFWDQIHPSATSHQLLAAGMYEVVPEPVPLALVGFGLVLLILRRRTALTGRR